MPLKIMVGEFEITVDPFVMIEDEDGDLIFFTRDKWREVRDAVDRLLEEKSVDAEQSQD